MKLNILRADPAGNITLFVLDPVPKQQRAAVAARLMALPTLAAEQVGFIDRPTQGGHGRMEMMGGEFCGNATRAFGLLLAQEQGDLATVLVETSGCAYCVQVAVDLLAGTAQAQMPLPQSVEAVAVDGHLGTLVNLGGIAHLVVEGIPPSQAFFQLAEELFQTHDGLDAYGVMFFDSATRRMIPLVKVPATNTLVWEGSCGSGSLACAVAQSQGIMDGTFARDYIQPAGTVRATVVRTIGAVTQTYIGGPVTLETPIVVELS